MNRTMISSRRWITDPATKEQYDYLRRLFGTVINQREEDGRLNRFGIEGRRLRAEALATYYRGRPGLTKGEMSEFIGRARDLRACSQGWKVTPF